MGKSIVTFRIHHSVYETDFDDYHSWQSSALTTTHNDELTVRRMTEDVAELLRAAGCVVVIVESASRTSYPSEW